MLLPWLALTGMVVLFVFRELKRKFPEPTIEERMDSALAEVLSALELAKHDSEVLEDVSVSLMALMDEMEMMRWND